MQKVNNLSSRGFSLVELIIAASITAILGLSIFATFSAGFKAYRTIKSINGSQYNVLLSLKEFERDLRNAFSFSGISFIGNKKEISFPGLIKKTGSVGRIAYFLSKDIPDSFVKTEHEYSSLILENKIDSSSPKVLALIKDLDLSYYYLDPAMQKYFWSDSFNSSLGNMPVIVKIRVTFQDGDKNSVIEKNVLMPMSQ